MALKKKPRKIGKAKKTKVKKKKIDRQKMLADFLAKIDEIVKS